mmetsp:Transcript_5624/g.17086  ORF Transcript_5624/g.17086 Transcript_5624/m.17086 type:complete len:204 (-) Transcript_5624:450-1061(-)
MCTMLYRVTLSCPCLEPEDAHPEISKVQVLFAVFPELLLYSPSCRQALGMVGAPLLPIRLLELARPVPDVLAVHLPQGLGEIRAISKADEPKPSALLRPLLLNHLGLVEGLVPGEGLGQQVVRHFRAQVAREEPEVVLRPLPESRVHPLLPSDLSYEHLLRRLRPVLPVDAPALGRRAVHHELLSCPPHPGLRSCPAALPLQA